MAEAALSLPGPEMMTMVHLIQAKRSPVIIGGVMAAVVASALVPLVVQFAGGGRSDFASIGATFLPPSAPRSAGHPSSWVCIWSPTC